MDRFAGIKSLVFCSVSFKVCQKTTGSEHLR